MALLFNLRSATLKLSYFNSVFPCYQNILARCFCYTSKKKTLSETSDENHKKPLHAKVALCNIFNNICSAFGQEYLPRYNSELVTQKKACQTWKTSLTIMWPNEFKFETVASSKKEAERKAAFLACSKLKELGVLTIDDKPILQTKSEKELLKEYQNIPSIHLDSEVVSEVNVTIKEWQNFYTENCHLQEQSLSSREVRSDSFTGWPFHSLSPKEIAERNHRMYMKHTFNERNDNFEKIQSTRQSLPIWTQRDALLAAIEENQVIVLSGETGCGKSTQVPQFILEKFIQLEKGSECNIVVTQPRRISAISLAEYIAYEQDEKVGQSIGYQVRLESRLPNQRGGILFCTTGILLRHLQSNPDLKGISHIVVDEAHVRDIFIDMLLVVLKTAISRNPDLKVIIMSASLNSELFSKYFNDCPMFHVPGFMYPVEQHFLPEVLGFIKSSEKLNSGNAEKVLVDYELVSRLIKKIHNTKPEGGILCFLPGWQDIKSVEKLLQNSLISEKDVMILPVHSALAHDMQKRIFERAPLNVRKIILATNIAETSITINDIVYVIDPGIANDNSFNAHTGITCLGPEWISKANVQQRKGRAGRVQPGESFHLFTKEQFEEMPDYPIPEIRRVALESFILFMKVFFPDINAESFFAKTLEPPDSLSVQKAVRELQEIGALNYEEKLTLLGEKIVSLNCHPRLAKMLIYASLFCCQNPLLNVAAILSHHKDPFLNTLEEKATIREVKSSYSCNSYSDHIALSNIFDNWFSEFKNSKGFAFNFCENNQLSYLNMTFIKGLKAQMLTNLQQAGLSYTEESSYRDVNKHSSDYELVKAVLCGGLANNVAQVKKGVLRNNRLLPKLFISLVFRKNFPVMVRSDSVLKKVTEFPSPWIVYFSKVMSVQSKIIILRDISIVHPLAVLLFSGRELTLRPTKGSASAAESAPGLEVPPQVILTVDNLKALRLVCDPSIAYLIVEFRRVLQQFIAEFLKHPQNFENVNSEIYHLQDKIIQSFRHLVNSSQSSDIFEGSSSKQRRSLSL